MFQFRKTAAVVITSVFAASTLLSASAASTTKSLSSNFTLVNLTGGTNNGTVQYVKQDGGEWKTADSFTLNNVGDQIIYRQYDANNGLPAGSGSVVVSTDGPVGAVVQIQARNQTPSSGAYVGVSEGAPSANVPLVQKERGTASGISNSQIIIQNASGVVIDVEVELIPGEAGLATFTKTINDIAPNASFEYDLADEADANLPDDWYGSAIVRTNTSGGSVAVVSNKFNGVNTLQTFNAFTESSTKWGVPLFASRLDNELNTPVAVQNVGTSPIPVGSVALNCVKDAASTGDATFTKTNTTEIAPDASYFFNPVTDASFLHNWFGACTVDSGSFQTAVFIQLRKVLNTIDPNPGITPNPDQRDRSAAHEGINLNSTDKRVVIPLYAKRLANGFATAITILNLNSSAPANVNLVYSPSKELVAADPTFAATCNVTFAKTIPAGGSLIQNLRLPTGTGNDNPNSVPQLPERCYGGLTVTSSDQPVDAFVQFDTLDELRPSPTLGDPQQAHNAFTVAVN